MGSEGTLGFVAEATFRTVPVKTSITSALAVFSSLQDANRALPALVETGVATLELMDATSLRVGQSFADAPEQIRDLDVAEQAALLVEYQATSDDELAEPARRGDELLASLPLVAAAPLSTDAAARGRLWKLRKGLYTSVAGARPRGTTALLEDVVVPVASLAETCVELGHLFDRFDYRDSVIFGHARDGNIHFMLTDRFESDEAMGRYTDFTESMVDLVLGQGGSLKAEHGTGRVMSPYVRRQFGDELYDVMRRLKLLVDPAGMLNPGVILDDDPEADYAYDGVQTCAVDSMCQTACPVLIDTGALVKRLRR